MKFKLLNTRHDAALREATRQTSIRFCSQVSMEIIAEARAVYGIPNTQLFLRNSPLHAWEGRLTKNVLLGRLVCLAPPELLARGLVLISFIGPELNFPDAALRLSAFYYYGSPLLNGLSILNVLGLLAVAAVALTIASVRFMQKDIGR